MDVERVDFESLVPGEDDVIVPRALLELCLGIIEEVHKTYQTGTNFNDDVLLAMGQLREHLK